MSQEPESADEVVTDLLEKSGQAFLTDDFDAFHACIQLPYHLETFEGMRIVSSDAELRDLFLAVRAHPRKTNVTDMARHVVEAVYKDDDTVVATFETRLLNGNTLTQAPYPVFVVVRRDDMGWEAQQMTFAIEDSPDHNALLMGAGTK